MMYPGIKPRLKESSQVSQSYFVSKLLILLSIFLFMSFASRAEDSNNKETTPADVFVIATKVNSELELIQSYMGKPKAKALNLSINSAAPREVYFQALTLLDKTEQLTFDQTRTITKSSVETPKSINPGHVFGLVNQSLNNILVVKKQLGILTAIKKVEFDPSRTPSDVFIAITRASRQVNGLLDRQFAPKEVYKRVTLAIGYSARLLSYFSKAEKLPKHEALQKNKKPADVYQRLLNCFEKLRQVGELSKLEMLTLNWQSKTTVEAASLHGNSIVPSDVYDIASLVVSELDFIHSQLENSKEPYPVFDPGRKFPSDVFQRVSILEQQLDILLKRVKKSPGWIASANL